MSSATPATPSEEVIIDLSSAEVSGASAQTGPTQATDTPFVSVATGASKPSKPFYKKKGVIIAVAVVLLLAIVGACSGSHGGQDSTGDASQTATKQSAPSAQSTDSSSSDSAGAVDDASVTVKSIEATYDGSTVAGEVLDQDNSGIEVVATYSDGTKETVEDWTIDSPAKLKAGKKSTVLIEYEGADTELTVKCTSLTAKQYKKTCKSYSYKKLAKHPKKYMGKNIKLTGKVIQVLDDGTGTINLRVNVTKGSYGIWSDTVLVVYEYSGDDEERVLEDDIVTLWGMFTGQYSYESTMGATITVPSMQAKYLNVH